MSARGRGSVISNCVIDPMEEQFPDYPDGRNAQFSANIGHWLRTPWKWIASAFFTFDTAPA